MSEQQLEKEINTYQEAARENPGVDANLLMLNALEVESSKHASGKSYKWPYVVALGLPPFGLVYTIKYLINGDDEDRRAGKICAILTAVSILLLVMMAKLFFSTANVNPVQLEQVKPSDLIQLYQ